MATPNIEVSGTLKEALFETLNAILSPIHDVRANAEDQLKVLEVTDEFGVHLAELTVDPNGLLPIRQLASVLLKQYVEVHWCQHSEKFHSPETTEEAKATIRQLLPLGLRESISKVRSSIAYAISAIAHWDWPENWPELFDILMHSLTSEDHNAVHGGMRVLTEFCNEVTDNQMPQVAPIILPQMYRIFTSSDKYNIRVRGHAVEIFSTCVQVISMMVDYNKKAAKELLYPISTQFTEALVAALLVPDGVNSDSGLKKDVLNALTLLVKCVPKLMSSWLPHILTPVWNALTESASIYVKTVVNDTEDANNPVDSDGEVLGFENLVFSIFEFVNVLVESPKFRNFVKKGLSDLMYYIVLYMQITEEQINIWTNNPDQFVEDEDEETFSYSVRISAQDLLLSLCQEFDDDSTVGLCNAISKHLEEAEIARNSGNPFWWKIHESCMVALGSVRDLIIDQIQNNSLPFDLSGFLQTVVLADLNLSVSPFLVGRSLWMASRFCIAMSPDLIQRFLQATVNGIQPSQPSSVRVSAVRAVWGFCEHLKASQQTSILIPYLPPVMEGLINLATQFSSEVLALVMESITIALSVDKDFMASIEERVLSLAIAAFLKHNSDPILVSLSQDVFKELAQNAICQNLLQQRLVPTLVSILHAPVDKIPMGLQGVALDILQTLVRNSSRPLPEPLLTSAFPAAVHCILHTDDNTTLQNGGECLRAYVSVSLDQVVAWHDETGCSGLVYVVQVAQHLLDPKTSESSAAYVGRLVSTLIFKAGGTLGENTELLLRAVLSKMQQTETLTVIQSLVMVFAHLVHHQMPAVLDFLSSVPGPTGKSALEFVLTEWCSRQHLFFGAYENKVSTLALCKLLEHSIKTNDRRLTEVNVKGDQIIDLEEGIKTRTKSAQKPPKWTEIPVVIKIYKLLINELSNSMEQAMTQQDDDYSDMENWDEDEDESIDMKENDSSSMSRIMSQYVPAANFSGYDIETEDCDDEDPDAISDPLYHINMQNFLTQFLHTLSQQSCYNTFMQHHTPEEKQVLSSIGISI
ncbi:importin-9 [Centruroides vittatus]|uniref:importin-9 n=1 Tax=Centruroides vittatus TaxID=120091 RepID=UPI003510C09F